MINVPVQPVVRELRCSKCRYGTIQRMNDDGGFKKLPEKCPRCGRTNCFGVIRVFTQLNQ